jgi:hypothetical protein
MKKRQRQKMTRIVVVLFIIINLFLFDESLQAEPKPTEPEVKAGDCPACHITEKVLPEKHADTREMDWDKCKACHKKDSFNLAGKIPGSHTHQLAYVTCVKCHGKEKQKVPSQDTCLTCHGGKMELIEKTKHTKPINPHTPHHHYRLELECNSCHHQHIKSVTYCIECHKFDFTTP